MTLGNTALTRVRFLVWCLECGHRASRSRRNGRALRRRYHRAGLARAASRWRLAARGGSIWSSAEPSANRVEVPEATIAEPKANGSDWESGHFTAGFC
jgi:hypothetical protein